MKFNTNTHNQPASTVNHAGATAVALSPELALYAAVVTTMLSDDFYEKADDRLGRIRHLIGRVDAEFVAKLAVYAREQMYLRTAPLVLTGELATCHNGDDLVGRTVRRVVQRPDEITELLAYYAVANKRRDTERGPTKKLNRLSKQVQKGLAASFNRFDEYQFAKYDRAASGRQTAVTLRDALFLVHPKAKDDAQQAVFDKIVTRSLETPYTWETELSALGQQDFKTEQARELAVRSKWQELIGSGRLGYMATLRNLRNMLQANVGGKAIDTVAALLANPDAVRKAKQLPFRFLAAYRELKAVDSPRVGTLLDALESAIWAATANLRGFDTETRVLIAADVSGSMQTPISARSSITRYDIGLLLAMLLQSRCKQVTSGMFGDTWKTVTLPNRQVLANVDALYKREGEVGYSTNGYLVVKDLVTRRVVMDKVMIFTDCQLWDSNTGNRADQNTLVFWWAEYRQLAPSAKLYLFDLAGYGTAPVTVESNGVRLIAGWSDKVFDVLNALEDGASSLKMIDRIVL
jgi:60 kDa SS-A/Ro ribonucleoprotein